MPFLQGCSSADESGKKMPNDACDGGSTSCKGEVKYKLVSITVIANATQNNVIGAKNWAAVKKATDGVIVEATTSPNDATGWGQISWSGDTGSAVPGHPNQRSLALNNSRKLHIEAALGGVTDHLDVWVIWATITIQTSGTTPKNAIQFKSIYLGPEILGAVISTNLLGLETARGKVVVIAQITPVGINKVVQKGWLIKRIRISRDWMDGKKNKEGNTRKDLWNMEWVDDTLAELQMLVPTNDPESGSSDQIFDIDAPSIGLGTKDYETYNNFRQWVEWNTERCSEDAEWYWKGIWKESSNPKIILKEVGTGNITLPTESPLHPAKLKSKK